MSFDGYIESFDLSLHKVAAATSVYVQLYSSRHNVTTLSVNTLCTDNRQVGIKNFDNFRSFTNH